MTFNIMTYNCRGLRNTHNREKVFEWIKGKKMDIILLQETHSSKSDEIMWGNEWGGNVLFSHGKTDAKGVMVLVNKSSNIEICEWSYDDEGRVIYALICMYGKEILIVNVYAPNEDDPSFYKNVFEQILKYGATFVVIGGDYNLVLDVSIDKSGGLNRTNVKAQSCVKEFMELLELNDAWRVKHPNLREYTWRRRKPTVVQCRLDYFLVSQSLMNNIKYINIGTSFMSDHSIVYMSFELEGVARGPGYWMLNCSLLYEKEYVTKIKNTIRECENMYEESVIDKILFWETMKMNIRTATIEYACEKSRNRKKLEKELEVSIQKLEKKESLSVQEEEELNNYKTMLENVICERMEGSKIRSRAKLYEEDEKMSKYFLNLEKANQAKKSISHVKTEEGDVITRPDQIRNEISKYYKRLYAKYEEQCTDKEKNLFLTSIDKTLTEEEKLLCEGEISRIELLEALKQTGRNKAPGIDGLPSDFYKMFWLDVSDHMLCALNAAYVNGEMSINQRKGIISLIPKKDKDTAFIKNLRPITLLCSDYKLASKVIANRLKKHLPKLINADQCGFVSHRYIGQNINVLSEIIEYCENYGNPGIVLSVDYRKAFDLLNWAFIEDTLIKYRFGDGFIRWVKLFYNNIDAVVNVNGYFTDPFPIERGVKQGDPISPYLFILCAEVLAEYIRKNENIKGIVIGKTEHKISMLADDTNIFMKYCKESLDHVLLSLEQFSRVSGLIINFEKSSAYCIGMKNAKELDVKNRIYWAKDIIETLGVKIPTHKGIDVQKLNYEPKIVKIENIIKSWSSRNLSLRGKVIVIRSLIMSQFQYIVSVIGPPCQKVVQRINKIIYKYLWNGSEKLKRSIMINSLEEGGLNVPDFETICKCAMIRWVHRYIHSENSNWKSLVNYTLRKLGQEFIFKCNLRVQSENIDSIKSPLWRNVMKAWCEMNYMRREYVNRDDIVWMNSNLPECLFDKESIEKGLIFIKQFYDGETFVTYNDLCVNYDVKLNVLYYHRIVNMIRERYNESAEDINTIQDCNKITRDILEKPVIHLLSKKVYRTLVAKKIEYNDISLKWQDLVLVDVNNALFPKIEKLTIVNKLRSFQFKFLHKILYFNDKLFKYKLVNSTLCDFCNENIDSIEHRYLYCRVTQQFFKDLGKEIRKKYNFNCEFNDPHVIVTNQGGAMPIIDTILLNAKYYVFTCFVKKTTPVVASCMRIIDNLEKTERHIAERKNLLCAHERKWSMNVPII